MLERHLRGARRLPPPGPAPINMLRRPGSAFLIQYVAAKNRVPVKLILGQDRRARAVAVRHEAMRVVFAHTELTSSQIGRAFNRHHASVLYAVGHVTRGSKARVERVADRIKAAERLSSLDRRLQWKARVLPIVQSNLGNCPPNALNCVSASENGHI
jgi:hypothetical protein